MTDAIFISDCVFIVRRAIILRKKIEFSIDKNKVSGIMLDACEKSQTNYKPKRGGQREQQTETLRGE